MVDQKNMHLCCWRRENDRGERWSTSYYAIYIYLTSSHAWQRYEESTCLTPCLLQTFLETLLNHSQKESMGRWRWSNNISVCFWFGFVGWDYSTLENENGTHKWMFGVWKIIVPFYIVGWFWGSMLIFRGVFRWMKQPWGECHWRKTSRDISSRERDVWMAFGDVDAFFCDDLDDKKSECPEDIINWNWSFYFLYLFPRATNDYMTKQIRRYVPNMKFWTPWLASWMKI